MKINMGFESLPYAGQGGKPFSARKKTGQPYGQGKTTDEVAKELEDKYGIVEKFAELEEDNIMMMLVDTYALGLEAGMEGKPVSEVALAGGFAQKLEEKFRQALSSRAFDGVIPGVPTRAARRGVSHLLAQPYAKGNPSRPSFIDTSLYQQSFSVWLEED